MPSNSSPLDLLPCSLLKSCSEVFAPAIARLANLSMQTRILPATNERSVYTAKNNKEVTVLIGLDLSAAFDTVDHEILLQRLQTEFRVEGMPLTWLRSYLDGRTQYVKIGQHQSTAIQLRGQYWDPSCSPSTPVQLLTYCKPRNSSKIISRPNSIRHVFTLTPTWAICCNGNTPKIRVE